MRPTALPATPCSFRSSAHGRPADERPGPRSPGRRRVLSARPRERQAPMSTHGNEDNLPPIIWPPGFGQDPNDPADIPSWQPVDLTSYLDGTHTPVVPTLLERTDGICLFYPGLVHSLHGESESGKSLVAQYLAAQQIKAGNDVLFIDFESDAATVTDRLLMLGATPEAIREHFHYIHPEADPRVVGAEK